MSTAATNTTTTGRPGKTTVNLALQALLCSKVQFSVPEYELQALNRKQRHDDVKSKVIRVWRPRGLC